MNEVNQISKTRPNVWLSLMDADQHHVIVNGNNLYFIVPVQCKMEEKQVRGL